MFFYHERIMNGSDTCESCECTAPALLEERSFRDQVYMLKALGHPVRLRMIDLIHQHGDELCVCEFEHHFDLKQPTLSHHLKILRDAGLIVSRQDGHWVRHAIAPAAFARIHGWMRVLAVTPEPA